ncbi:DUF6428 family protein [Deinococcus yavapaiensis]|uniref:Uncharacterized protein n=1 Tax=Deinococcus yavapaiensis KR-236 TaxID=694435 RepID=A0A318SAK7_9DEIO|nr:DUF6428 family protein [Deinococcus yavapaiensis]PYE53281.1 hypothetical protein DES52_10953 [Deinococcus yavapaiensis KR-236]
MTQILTAPDRTQAFLDTLEPHANKLLIFQLHGETLVREGYHVTEVKAVTIEAMDCGGRADAWRETVVQLWNGGGEEDQGFMTVDKFLAIYRRVAASVPVRRDAKLRFEYGDAVHPTIQYFVGSVDAQVDRVLVNLGYPAVSCKPNDERIAAGEAACCGPASARTAELVALDVLPTAPAKGCC